MERAFLRSVGHVARVGSSGSYPGSDPGRVGLACMVIFLRIRTSSAFSGLVSVREIPSGSDSVLIYGELTVKHRKW